jgi:RNA polymerase sigma factor (sigma-70 family)
MSERSASRRYGRLDDARLAALVRQGDTRAFEVLYDRHHAALLSFCRHMLGNLQDGEDALQQTFLRAHRALSDGPPPDAMRPWLFAIARNRCRTLLAARREATVALEDFEPSLDGLAEDVGRRADLRELVQDLARLPEDQREALVLFELGGSSQTEIARVLACPPAKVKALVFQARSTLIAERDARSTPCEAIREQLAVARGGVLRRGSLRRHLRQCAPCDAYRLAVAGQRDALASLLPVLPTAGLKAAVLAAAGLSGGGSAAAAAGGAASLGGVAASGGAASAGGLAVTALVAKVALTVAVAGAGVSGAVAAVGSGGGAAPEVRTATPTSERTTPARRPTPTPAPADAGTDGRLVTAPAEAVPSRTTSRRRGLRRHRARRAALRRRIRHRAARRRRIAALAPRREARLEARRDARIDVRRQARREVRRDARQDARRQARREARRDAADADDAPLGGSAPAPRPRPARTKPAPAPAGDPPVRPRRPRPPVATATPAASATPAAVPTP